MQYFNSLPLIAQNTYNNVGNNQVVTNLLSRAYLLPPLLKNVMFFYEYDIKDDETPETIAYNYYDGDVYKYWILLYSNNIFDVQNDWPKSNPQFNAYLEDKYKEQANGVPVLAYTMSTIHHYEKIITTSDDVFFEKKVVTIQITEDEYNSLMTGTTTRTFNTGTTITQDISKQAVSIFTYETKLNENKRRINLMRKEFIPALETKFQEIMQ